MSNRPASSFRLNAPQAMDSEAEGSNPFGDLGDNIEDPNSENFIPTVKAREAVREQPRSSGHASTPLRPMSTTSSFGISPDDPRLAALAAANHELTNGDGTVSPQSPSRMPIKCLIGVGVIVILLLVGLIVAVAVALGGGNNSPSNMNGSYPTMTSTNMPPTAPTVPPAASRPVSSPVTVPTMAPSQSEPTPAPKTTLGRVFQRGFLRCGVSDSQPGFATVNIDSGDYEGFDVDMCRAVAAAIFGEDGHVEYVSVSAFNRFIMLADDAFDMLARTTTHTMEREFLESSSGSGFSFSIPYLYNGLQFAGEYPYVECADNLTVSTALCNDTKICALDSTTHIPEIIKVIPDAQIVAVVGSEFLYSSFISGFCNVIAGEQFDIAEAIIREKGYLGNYTIGKNAYSKEPLCIVTRDDDEEWSDFVNWILQAVLTAEDAGVSSLNSNVIPTTTVFGDKFASIYRDAVGIVGNYGEMYRRHLEALLPRPAPDLINSGDSGLIYAMPFGDLDVVGDGPIFGGTLEKITERGYLRCGISRRVIFAQFNASSQSWSGFDVDFCRALSAAIFNGVTDTVVYTDLAASERFQALQNDTVDVLSRITTATLSRDVLEPSAGVGFSFSQPNFYDGLTFGGIPPYSQCADRLDVTSISCRGLLICVNQGTTFETRVQTLFPERFIVPRLSGELTVEGLASGECNVIAGGVVDVSVTSIRSTGYEGSYQTGISRYSKDPLALVTREDDVQWNKFVSWIVSTIFYAEEQGITQATAKELPTVSLVGPLFFNMFRDAVGAVGNYGEIYERNAQADVPRGGLNEVNVLLSGPQHYPLPGVL